MYLGYMDGVAKDLATLRDGFTDVCNPPGKTLAAHGGNAGITFDDMFGAWWQALDNMAGSNAAFADATQQAAVIYEHVDRKAIQLPPGPPLTDAQKKALEGRRNQPPMA
jgi:hypothetical protein